MMTDEYAELTYGQWLEKYKPIKNKFSKDPEQIGFETYGEEWDFVKSQDPKYVWTNVQGDFSDLLVAGVAYVNRLQYYITEIPWENSDHYIIISEETECECYNEEEYEDGEVGRADCEECEGSGWLTKYND
jgi:hypothetical protein